MPSIEITGSIDWATRRVKLDRGICSWSGRFIWSGIHKGQVGIDISTNNCNDTYYGKPDWSTNPAKFKVTIPNNCCDCVCDCSYCQTPCSQPNIVEMTMDDIEVCPDKCFIAATSYKFLYNWNQGADGAPFTRVLTNTGGCIWEITDTSQWVTVETYRFQSHCGGTPTSSTTYDDTHYEIKVNSSGETEVRIYIDNVPEVVGPGKRVDYFVSLGGEAYPDKCIELKTYNGIDPTCGIHGGAGAKNGYAEVFLPDSPGQLCVEP